MKIRALFTLLLTWCIGVSCHQPEEAVRADLPLTMVDGYGPFHPGFSTLNNEHKNDPERRKFWGKMYLSVKGIPKNWVQADKAMVWLNTYQLIYQNFLAGNFTEQQYKSLQKNWSWLPDTAKLSEKPIKCFVYTVRGFDTKSGKWAVMIDTNNDLDFSDESPIYPEAIKNEDPYTYKNPKTVQYEIYRKGKIMKATAPMIIKTMGSEFLYNFPQHAQAILKRNGKEYPLAIISGFTGPNFENPALIEISSVGKKQRVQEDKLTKINENIVLGGVKYKNKGVDFYHNLLRLDPVNDKAKEYSLQVGYPFRPFSAREFITKQPIAFTDYKGKYVYVDFWGTWCRGCVDDIPSLKKMYQELDKTRFEFIGIAQDSPEQLTNFIKKRSVNWPQILSDSTNKLIESYGISSYPTSVLVDPKGIVIARNIRGDELAVKLRALNK